MSKNSSLFILELFKETKQEVVIHLIIAPCTL